MLEQVSLIDENKSIICLNDISSLLLYVQSQNGSSLNGSNSIAEFGFNDSRLIKLHNGSSSLYLDKYFECSIPDVQTEFLLESTGVSPEGYDAYLGRGDSKNKFWVKLCELDGVKSELVTPIISGGRYNPYVRFASCKTSGQIQLKKMQDLVGANLVDVGAGVPIHNLMVFTFPKEVGLRLLNPRLRSKTISKIWSCWKQMFKELRYLFHVDPACLLGCNVSLHLWSSEIPVLPHPHLHVVLPHFSYLKVSKEYREDCEALLSSDYDCLYSIGTAEDIESRKDVLPVSVDERKRLFKDERRNLLLSISSRLSDLLYFEQLERQGLQVKNNRLPLDVSLVRFMWSEIVDKVFNISADGPSNYDVYTEFVKHDNIPKLLHYLQYKNRPVILDLDLFFRKCQNVVSGYHPENFNWCSVVDYVRGLFVSSVLREDVRKASKYESLLNSVESVSESCSVKDLFGWVQFLSSWPTDTRVYGFWQNIKRYRITSVLRGELSTPDVCPICGGEVTSMGGNSGELCLDYIIVNFRSTFKVYQLSCDSG